MRCGLVLKSHNRVIGMNLESHCRVQVPLGDLVAAHSDVGPDSVRSRLRGPS